MLNWEFVYDSIYDKFSLSQFGWYGKRALHAAYLIKELDSVTIGHSDFHWWPFSEEQPNLDGNKATFIHGLKVELYLIKLETDYREIDIVGKFTYGGLNSKPLSPTQYNHDTDKKVTG